MLSEMQDRDAIISNAIKITSPEVRQAYIAGACGNDATLRRQVEELVTEHFRGGSPAKSAATATLDPRPHRAGLEYAGANHHSAADEAPGPRTFDIQWDSAHESVEAEKMGQKKPRGLLTVWALLLLPATVGGAGVTVWKMQAKEPAAAMQKLQEERDEAQKAKAETEKQLNQAMESRQTLEAERDAALAAEKAARRSEHANRAVVAFLQDKLLSVSGNPSSWAGEGFGKDVTLRKAVDAAESKVAAAFMDKPLVEASIRQVLGSTYLALGEPARAVKQYEQALRFLEAEPELGPASSETGDCRNQLAVALRRDGRPDEASRLFESIPRSNKKGRETKREKNPARGQSTAPQSSGSLSEDKLFEDS